jgi:transcription-repair coupling factor (superfamily II helicase)
VARKLGRETAEEPPKGLREALTKLRRRLTPIQRAQLVVGVCPGARAIPVAALAHAYAASVVVVPSQRDAEELLAGLELLSPELPAAMLPAEGVETYQGHVPPLGATAAVVRALLRLAREELRVLVVPARLLPYPLPRPDSLLPRCPHLEPGQAFDPQGFARLLLGGGYRRTEVVEEAGEFALRGQVLDLGTPEQFVRVLLEVDTIERLSGFDPATQRSSQTLSELVVTPLRLFPAGEEYRVRLAWMLEGNGNLQAAQAAREATSPQWWEGFLGWAQPHARAWELTPGLVVCEPATVGSEVERTLTVLGRAREALARDQVALPAPATWLATLPECRQALAGAHRIEELDLDDGGERIPLATSPTPVLASRPQALLDELRRGIAEGRSQAVVTASAGETQRLTHLLGEAEIGCRQGWPAGAHVGLLAGDLAHGFFWRDAAFVLYGRGDVTHLPAPARKRRALASVLADMRDLKVGDLVVHADHGIGRFCGFRTISLDGESHECVELEYAGSGRLLVPLERADVLEKYAGSEGAAPRLDRLGGTSWSHTKAKVKKALKDLAEALLKVQAQREVAPGIAFARDGPWQREFEASFEYEVTSDQEQAIREVKRDMESPRPMDRLLVGDVGYGKTEVAMRAAFKAVMDGRQVALLAPTTILAEQHYRTFARRFAGFPLEIRWLSRFLPAAERRKVVADLAAGTVDIVIGTHRLLARDVGFRDLGLVIVDEEQRFGVAQKEKLKAVKAAVDVLSLSATPIPRTLNLGLLGLRDVSIIETPPRDRLAVQTHVLPFRREAVREAVLTELARGGQVFFVHNRVASIAGVARLLQEIVPEAKVVVAHGQMDERALERAMDSFLDGEADVLLATSIVENGLDIPNANTLIVHHAERFGLAQLYQLRGRVGRSDRLAFAYLLVPPERSLSEEARARLAAIMEFADLGAGFRIAARDLEIRGAGSLLGAEQHGHLRAVGYQTYCRLLEEAVRELRGEEVPMAPAAVELRLGLDLRLPEAFIPEETLRLEVYRSVAAARDGGELEHLRQELADRFGPPPTQLAHLLLHQRLRRRAEALGIARLRRAGTAYEVAFEPGHPNAHPLAMALLEGAPGASLSPTGVLRVPAEGHDAATSATALLELLPQPET